MLRVFMITQKVDLDDDVLGFTHTWVNKLAERVAQLHVLALSGGRHELHDNVTLYTMGKEQGAGRLRRFVNFYRVAAPLILRRQVDVVFVHMCPIYAVLAAPWARLVGVPVVMWYSHAHVSTMLRLAHTLSTHVLTASPGSYSLPGDKVRVMGHGIDLQAFHPAGFPSQNLRPRVVTVGRISPVKDYVTLIESASWLVNEMHRDVEFQIVGAAPTQESQVYFDGLRARTAAHGLKDRVAFVGSVPNRETPHYYRQADVFVNMQARGGVGKSVLEAMACGVPCALCTPAFNGQLGDFVPEVIFREKDAGDLAQKLVNVLDMRSERRQEFSRLVRRIAAQHSVDHLMEQMVALFEACAQGGQ
jgi:glycosyltransferase involved in cell wall biosynthesis